MSIVKDFPQYAGATKKGRSGYKVVSVIDMVFIFLAVGTM
jgi:hypothetical protein